MKNKCIAALLVLSACGGSLSDEQRKKIREDMQQHQIVRISDAEITEAAFTKGRTMITLMNKHTTDKNFDSLADIYKMKVKWIVPGAAHALDIENQLIEAYIVSSGNGGLEDNIQKMGSDSLLYTKPVTEKLPDGSENVKGMWSIRFSKKQLILSIKR